MLPISIGVFGNWGSGKSSLMLLLQQSLQEWGESQQDKHKESQQNEHHNPIILQVYFNSWQFESYDSTKLTMIESILEALLLCKNHLNKTQFDEIHQKYLNFRRTDKHSK